jgi:methylated-DNA-[protein]-cysteine S-methyltransferase
LSTRHAVIETPELGALTIVASGASLVGVYFPGHWTRPDRAGFGCDVDCATDPVLREAEAQLREFLSGTRTSFALSTAADGSPFEERVWALVKEIPFGETATYGELAERLGDKALARRVGQAVGRNPLSIVVACHRVVGKGGELRGYAGGLSRKQFLLELEQPAAARARDEQQVLSGLTVSAETC